MKAYVLHGINKLKYEDVSIPEVPKGWTLVEVKAAGICGSDIPRIFETGTYHFPTILGHEFSGIVRKTDDDSENDMIGKRVGIFPLIPCGKCECCRRQQYEMCSNYDYLGSRRDGGFSEYVLVPKWNLIELPENVSFEEAAMLEPMSVGIHALRRIGKIPVSSIIIYGLGPIGVMMAQWARIFCINDIYLVGNKKAQLETAHKLGFNNVCDSSVQDPVKWIEDLTNGKGVDMAVEGVGDNRVLSQTLESVKADGNILILGNPKGDLLIDKKVFWKIHRKQLKIFGSWNSSFTKKDDDDWHKSLEAISSGKMQVKDLITHKLEFDDLFHGLEIMREKKEYSCKIMVVR